MELYDEQCPFFKPGGGSRSVLKDVARRAFPEMNRWLDALTDPRCQALCVYLGRLIWWQIILTFILRGGSRNAFDGDRNTGELPGNVLQLCDQVWDEAR